MRTLNEFQAYYEQQLRPELMKVQAQRDATRPQFWRTWGLIWLAAIAIMAVTLVLVAKNTLVPGKPPWYIAVVPVTWFFTLIVSPIVLGVRINRWKELNQGAEKKSSLIPVVRFLAPEFDYRPTSHVSTAQVEASRIFELSGKLTSLEGDDHFRGKIGETSVEFSEITAHTMYRVQNDGKWETRRSADQGLFLSADFNKPFQHRTLVLPDFAEKLLGAEISGLLGGVGDFIGKVGATVGQFEGKPPRLLREGSLTPQQAGLQLIRMEHLDFERLFQVFCTDPVEANYILTPNIMERLAAFQQRMKYPLTLSFVGTSMYAYIPSGALFEDDVTADVSRFEAYRPYYEQLYVVFDLVDAMNLNTRLWTKT